jgi:imidazolonepropionase-like amidohydrolase
MFIAITGKRLIDGTGRPPIENAVVLVEGNHIVQVGTAGQVTVPAAAERIDCGDQTLLPGLIDSHTHLHAHLVLKHDIAGSPVQLDMARMAIRSTVNLRLDLKAGVTTMRSLGEPDGLDFRVREAVEEGDIPGPRLLVAGYGVRPSHGWGIVGSPVCDGVDQIRAEVRRTIALGADVIKIFVTNCRQGTADEANMRADLTRIPIYSKEEIQAAVDEAHRVGIRVAAHALGGPGLRDALEAGVDSIEHANLMEERDIELFLRTGAWLSDPNMLLIFDKLGVESLTWWRFAEWRRKVQFTRDNTRDLIPKAVKAGVKFALGTDPCHGLLWKEAQWTADLGVPEMDVLMAVTKNGAELLGIEDQVGTLEPGKLADVISVDGNPLDDMGCLRNVGLVMKDGQRYDHLL